MFEPMEIFDPGKTIDTGIRGGQRSNIRVVPPDECPVCTTGIFPIFVLAKDTGPERTEVVFQCTRSNCRRLFVAIYEFRPLFGRGMKRGWVLDGVIPKTPKKRAFDQVIEEISPQFVAIYQEAQIAETFGLTQVCGPGYRKALEFLVKDYLKGTKPADSTKIENQLLWPCIRDYVDDPRLKTAAQRAAWLGNDETHYRRIWVDKDVSDLKILLDLSVHWIVAEKLTREIEQDMPETKKGA